MIYPTSHNRVGTSPLKHQTDPWSVDRVLLCSSALVPTILFFLHEAVIRRLFLDDTRGSSEYYEEVFILS